MLRSPNPTRIELPELLQHCRHLRHLPINEPTRPLSCIRDSLRTVSPMRCRSVACIWSGSPPVHKVTAAAVLHRPPTLYTGGLDGSIVWWNVSSDGSNQETKPIAILCGHAAPIADLGVCFPAAVSGYEKIDDSSNDALNSSSTNYGALISACADGVLCIWSRSSGHCRRRRKMSPWVGSPSIIRTLPENRRYVCVGCSFVDQQSLHSSEEGEVLLDGESQCRKPSKCTVIIVDSYTLTVVQTVFHGNLSIGPLKFMSVILSVGDMEKQSVMMIDSFGAVQYIPILKDTDPGGENLVSMQRDPSDVVMADWVDGLNEKGLVVAFASCGQVLAFVYRTCCIFRLLDSSTTIGKISFLDDQLCSNGTATQSHVIGGMFLDSHDSERTLNVVDFEDIFVENFVVWSSRGSAVVYKISYISNVFKFEVAYVIPPVSCPLDVPLSLLFIQLNCCLLRIESISLHTEEHLLWKPHVTIWFLPQQHGNNGCQDSKLLGKGSFFYHWITNAMSPEKTMGLRNDYGIKTTGSTSQTKYLESLDVMGAKNEKYGIYHKGQLVSSSMVISESYNIPCAIVYGFYSGDIEVMWFDIFFNGIESNGGSPRHDTNAHGYKQSLSGHTAAVLCLAAHKMVGTSNTCTFNNVLVSGSIDCTIRIWDLDSNNLIKVMHQHAAPVRQIILPPPQTDHPWSDCFLSVGEDSCVALASFETLRVERMFPGHPYYPAKLVWDSTRGYLACLCPNHSGTCDAFDVLYIWDIKTGARERVLRGTAAHSMFDHLCVGIHINSYFGGLINGNTSASSLLLPMTEETNFSQSHLQSLQKEISSSNISFVSKNMSEPNYSQQHSGKGSAVERYPSMLSVCQSNKFPVKSSCPFPGIVSLSFDLKSLMSLTQKQDSLKKSGDAHEKTHEKVEAEKSKYCGDKQVNIHSTEGGVEMPGTHHITLEDGSEFHGTSAVNLKDYDWVRSLEGFLLQFSLSFLHLWNVDCNLDNLLITDMKLKRPDNFIVTSGLLGDRGSLTLTFPGSNATLELWKTSSEFCAMRSLVMVSLAQRMISLSRSCSAASSASLASFYMRNFAKKIPDIKPPLLQLLVSFWQDECEHVRMAARSLFHCAASRAIPLPLSNQRAIDYTNFLGSSSGVMESEHEHSSFDETSTQSLKSDKQVETQRPSHTEESEILAWLESFEDQDWISCVGGTSPDTMTSHVIVAAALAVWYPSLVKPCLVMLVVRPLIKLIMSMNEKYSSTAAEILAEGMESTWKACIGSEIPRLIGDIFFQIECVSGASANLSAQNPAALHNIRETLVGTLLPSLAMADIPGFLNVIESEIWSTASDSPVHIVSLMMLIRVVRGSPRNLSQYLDKVVAFILRTMDPGNSVMRKTCFQSSMAALKEVVRVFPMVVLNDTSTRLAVGDVIGAINSASIHVYDMQSVTKIKVLDASGPPGLPSLLGGASEMVLTTAVSALSFSPDGEGVVAFSEHGLVIRWWSLGSVWWERLSRNLGPVQCTKLIFVPPWEGFSPNSTRSSIMASVTDNDRQASFQEYLRGLSEMDRIKLLIHNLDLSYRLDWVGEREVRLLRHGQELGTFLI